MTAREKLLEATKELLWERGYEATSPRDIMEKSSVGQGSLYHHFGSKKELAAVALQSLSEDLLGIGEVQLSTDKTAKERLRDYLFAPRNAEKGCRLGRFAYDLGIEEESLRSPIVHYFGGLKKLVEAAFLEMQQSGEIDSNLSAEELTVAAVAVVQGGYILARVHRDPIYLTIAVRGFASLLHLPVPPPPDNAPTTDTAPEPDTAPE